MATSKNVIATSASLVEPRSFVWLLPHKNDEAISISLQNTCYPYVK